ncbi:S-adenosyl-L-methionine-dependent methyltransferase [Thozetella sp. PMI_491]|nr:S-adenosyl-L-methionine-dependent methyltransferase [Thozetella sp. PMI_491]
MSLDSLNELASQASELTRALTSKLHACDLTLPSVTQGGLESYPKDRDLQESRMKLIDALDSLRALVLGPSDYFQFHVLNAKHDLSVLNMLYRFNILTHIPLDGALSFKELAERTDLSLSAVRRILRHAELMHFLRETAPGSSRFEHTSFSAHIVKTPGGLDWLGHNADQGSYGTLRQAEAVEKFEKGGRQAGYSNETGMGLQFYPDKGPDFSLFNFLVSDGDGERKGWRMRRCAAAMGYLAYRNAGRKRDFVLDGFDWEEYKGQTVLDLGGSKGHLSLEIAKSHPDIKFIVNDLPSIEAQFNATKAAAGPSGEQLSFLGHDFFKPWPSIDFDIVMMRYILHDWSDSLAIKLLRNLVPELKPGSRIFVIESMMPEIGDKDVPRFIRHGSSSMDFQMWSSTNGKERSLSDWKSLFGAADSRFAVEECRIVPGNNFMFVHVVFGK